MKNRLISCAFALLCAGAFAQEGVKIGVQGGLPFNDFNDQVSVAVGANFGYMWALNKTLDLGLNAGYLHGFAETYQTDVVLTGLTDVQFAPVAASVRIWPSRSFSFGVDAGQAFGINDGNDGGLYYRPQMGYLMGPRTEVNLSYSNIDLEENSWTTVTFGVLYTIPSKRSRF